MLEGLNVAVLQPRWSRELKVVYPVLFCPERGPMLCVCVVFCYLAAYSAFNVVCLVRLFVVCRGLGGAIFVWEGLCKGFHFNDAHYVSFVLLFAALARPFFDWGGAARGGEGGCCQCSVFSVIFFV